MEYLHRVCQSQLVVPCKKVIRHLALYVILLYIFIESILNVINSFMQKLAVQATSLPKQYSWTTYHTSLSVPSHSPGSDMLMVLPHHTAPAFSGPYHPRPPECSASSLGSLGCARLPHRTAPAFSGPYHPRPPEYSASSLGSSGCARQPDSSNSTTETHFGSNPVQEVNLNPSSVSINYIVALVNT